MATLPPAHVGLIRPFHEVEEGNWCWVRLGPDKAPMAAVQGYKNKNAAANGAKEHNPDFYAKPPSAKDLLGDAE